jgi:transketolase
MSDSQSFEQKCINTIRFLAVDAVEKAKSGHPGMPMGAAAATYALWMRHLRHSPADPRWPDRDRFVLSAGHASMLLYAMLHLTGYGLKLEDIGAFRQWESCTPGHPEYGCIPGVEVTTGPLGQGFATAVGMAIAEAHLAARYNRPGFDIVDHCTYVLASDGDLMEGVAAEACSLAGHLGLGKLIVLYDDNKVSLAGSTALAFSEDVGARFSACGWHVQAVGDGNDVGAVDRAIAAAKAEKARPSLIAVRTTIGYGAPKKGGTFESHGSPLGPEETSAAKRALGWPEESAFLIPEDVLAFFRTSVEKGRTLQDSWEKSLRRYKKEHPEEAAEFRRVMAGELKEGWEAALPVIPPDAKDQATRKTSETILQALAPVLPELMGGSADLNPSCFTWIKGGGDFERLAVDAPGVPGAVGGGWNYAGRNVHFGVREHAMAAAASGMAIHGGILPFTGTFFTFSDYMRPSIRLAALMKLRVVYVFTHDSIGVGEDGPTHQPVEHLMQLRMLPNLTVLRPADACETVEAWRFAVANRKGPTALIFTRQNVPLLKASGIAPASGLRQGGYILWEQSTGTPQAILLATGSEVALALQAAQRLADEGIGARVVSMPSWEIFDEQPQAYRQAVLPPNIRLRVAVEAGIGLAWEHYVGLDGAVIGMKSFGASAPAKILFEKFGFSVDAAVAKVKELLMR